MALCSVPDTDPADQIVASATLQGFIGGAWTNLHTESLSMPYVPPGYGDSASVNFSLSASFSAALTCELRLVVRYQGAAFTPASDGSVLSVSASITDLRFTASDTAAECSGSSGTGGEEPGGGGEESECGCSWAEGAPCADGFAETAPVSTTHTEAAPIASAFTRRTCP